jgi:hypothetical protein
VNRASNSVAIVGHRAIGELPRKPARVAHRELPNIRRYKDALGLALNDRADQSTRAAPARTDADNHQQLNVESLVEQPQLEFSSVVRSASAHSKCHFESAGC